MSALSRWFIHTVAVQTFTGAGPTGDTYAASVDVKCLIEDKNQLVRDAAGEEVVSSTTIFAALADVAKFAPQSLVTAWDDPPAQVIARLRHSSGSIGLPDHCEIQLK